MNLTSTGEWFHITGRGWATATVETAEELGLYDPDVLSGTEVEIDGHTYTVGGVETFCILRSPEHPYHGNFGILIKGEPHGS